MSDKSPTLRGIVDNLRSGISKINAEAKQAAGKHEHDTVADTGFRPDDETGDGVSPFESIDPSSPDISEGVVIDSKPVKPAKRKLGLQSLNNKQKALLVVAIGGVMFAASQFMSPKPMPLASIKESVPLDTPYDSDEADLDAGEDLVGPAGTSSSVDDLGLAMFGESTQNDSIEMLDPFTGTIVAPTPAPVAAPAAEPAPLPAALESSSSADLLGLDSFMIDAVTTTAAAPVANAPELSGTQNGNPHSGLGELQSTSPNAEAQLHAILLETEHELDGLKSDLAKSQKELAGVKGQLAKANNTIATLKGQLSVSKQTSTIKPEKHVASSSVPRPQMCVSAVAQAARNCTTCVPHAFITLQGEETMVGHGDYIQGMRVSIVGDRIDLQNAKGDAIFKYWSSPNGCAG